jgi:hypothetical protein
MNRMKLVLAIMACAGAAFAVGSAGAEEPKVTVIKAGDALNAMKVVRDKETGKLRPATPDEMAQMGLATAPGYAPSIVVLSHPVTTMVTHADGSATIRRSLDDLDKVVVSRAADGTLAAHHGAFVPTTPSKPKE